VAQVGILKGIYGNATSDFVASLPINREPVMIDSGLSQGYLRPAPGIVAFGPGSPGAIDRGGIFWNGVCYRVLGSSFCSVANDGAITVLGDVGLASAPCAFDYSFDRLAISSDGRLYYWDGATLAQVTDVDLGLCNDAIFIAGYFMSTDGEFIVVTELNDPFAVNPLKYGSAELDPDPIQALMRLRGEAIALGRFTTQVFQNVGGNGFPFRNVPSAAIQRGAVGRDAVCYFLETIAFVGSDRNEALGVYIAGAGTSEKLSTREVDDALAALTDFEAASIEMESRVERNEQRLLVHLPTFTFVYHQTASRIAGSPIWTRMASGALFNQPYRGRRAVLFNGDWIVGDADGNLGRLSYAVSSHFGEVTGWQFDTALISNPEGRAIVHDTTLRGMLGEAPFGADPVAFRSWTIDGRTWSQERAASTGAAGNRGVMLQWRYPVRVDDWLGLRFRGADTGMATFAALDARVSPLSG
jgi:Phage stabilisation protein